MENTKDVIYNAPYFIMTKGKRYKRTSFKEKIKTKFKENKAITVIISTMSILMLADFILINSFMNIILQYR